MGGAAISTPPCLLRTENHRAGILRRTTTNYVVLVHKGCTLSTRVTVVHYSVVLWPAVPSKRGGRGHGVTAAHRRPRRISFEAFLDAMPPAEDPIRGAGGASQCHWSGTGARSAQKLGRLQPSIAVFPQECMGTACIFWANIPPFLAIRRGRHRRSALSFAAAHADSPVKTQRGEALWQCGPRTAIQSFSGPSAGNQSGTHRGSG